MSADSHAKISSTDIDQFEEKRNDEEETVCKKYLP